MSTYLTYTEAVEHTGVSRQELTLWVKAGKLDRSRFDGKWYFRTEDLDDALSVHDPGGVLCFTDDYNHFRDFGYSHTRIAERMGYDYNSFMKRVHRLGIYRGSVYESQARKVLDRLIDSGAPFTGEALPCIRDERLAAALLAEASAAERVRKVGSRRSLLAKQMHRVNVYEGVAA